MLHPAGAGSIMAFSMAMLNTGYLAIAAMEDVRYRSDGLQRGWRTIAAIWRRASYSITLDPFPPEADRAFVATEDSRFMNISIDPVHACGQTSLSDASQEQYHYQRWRELP